MIKASQYNAKKVWNPNKKSLGSSSRSKVFSSDKAKLAFDQQSPKVSKVYGPERMVIQEPNLWDKIKAKFSDWKKTKHDFAWFRAVNRWFVNFEGIKQFNRNFLKTFCIVLALFLSYLTFFDTHFLIKDYNIQFSDNSYLSPNQTNQLINNLQKNKALGVFPNNQYWFLNTQTLTASAKDLIPEIEAINLTNRTWPDKAEITIETKPILITLSVKENNEQKYWRVSPEGTIVSPDEASIWHNLVTVEKPYNITFQDKDNPEDASLKNFSFKENKVQLKKFRLIQKLWPVLEASGIKIVSTSVPSLVDSDIFFLTQSGTKLMFDSQVFDAENQIRRATEFLSKIDSDGNKIVDLEKSGKLKYIDFRIAKRLYYCYNGDQC